jgi:type II secretory pathway component PulF
MENHHATSESESYMARIGQAIEQSESLQGLLTAARAEFPHVRASASVTRLLEALQAKVPAEVWVADSKLAAMLPILLESQSLRSREDHEKPSPSNDSMRRLLTDTVGNRWKIPRELSYPLILMVLALLLLGLMLGTIVPVYEKMFLEFGLMLPRPTMALIQVGRFARIQPIAFVIAFVIVISAIVSAWIGLSGLLHRLQVVPSIGFLMAGSRENLSSMVRWISTLAELLSIGAPLPKAVEIAGVASQSVYYQRQSNQLARQLLESKEGVAGREAAVAFPATVQQALVGTPNIAVLRRMAEIYTDRLRNRKSRGYGFLGPVVIMLIGLLIGFMVIALFVPLISLISALSH